MTDPSELEALALAAESFGRLAEAINTVTEKMADAIARNSRDIEALRDENRALSNRIEAVTNSSADASEFRSLYGAYMAHLRESHGG